MNFVISNNPIDYVKCWLLNKHEDYTQKVWMRKPYKATCKICKDTLRSKECKFSPEQCGWERLEDGYWWVCHRCLEHRDFTPYIAEIDEKERQLWEKS